MLLGNIVIVICVKWCGPFLSTSRKQRLDHKGSAGFAGWNSLGFSTVSPTLRIYATQILCIRVRSCGKRSNALPWIMKSWFLHIPLLELLDSNIVFFIEHHQHHHFQLQLPKRNRPSNATTSTPMSRRRRSTLRLEMDGTMVILLLHLNGKPEIASPKLKESDKFIIQTKENLGSWELFIGSFGGHGNL